MDAPLIPEPLWASEFPVLDLPFQYLKGWIIGTTISFCYQSYRGINDNKIIHRGYFQRINRLNRKWWSRSPRFGHRFGAFLFTLYFCEWALSVIRGVHDPMNLVVGCVGFPIGKRIKRNFQFIAFPEKKRADRQSLLIPNRTRRKYKRRWKKGIFKQVAFMGIIEFLVAVLGGDYDDFMFEPSIIWGPFNTAVMDRAELEPHEEELYHEALATRIMPGPKGPRFVSKLPTEEDEE